MHQHILVISFFLSIAYSKNASLLKFIPLVKVDNSYNDPNIPEYDIYVDAIQPKQTDIRFIQKKRGILDYSITFYCQVEPLKASHYIRESSICKKESLDDFEECILINDSIFTLKFGYLNMKRTYYNKTKGFTTKWLLSSTKTKFDKRLKPVSGYYYCKLENDLGQIQSSYIRLYDYDFYLSRALSSVRNLYPDKKFISRKLIEPNKFPTYFDCGPLNYDPYENLPKWFIDSDQFSPFRWVFCKEDSFKSCIHSLYSNKPTPTSSIFIQQIFLNGTLKVYGLKNKIEKLALVCKDTGSKIFSVHAGEKDDNEFALLKVAKSTRQKIQPLSPVNKEVFIKEGRYRMNLVHLTARFLSTTNPKFKWTHNTKSLLYGKFTAYPQTLYFGNIISNESAGIYRLKIIQKNPRDSLVFKFNVVVVSAPVIISHEPKQDTLYIPPNEIRSVIVKYKSTPTKMTVLVNGFVLPTEINQLRSKYPYLNGVSMINEYYDNVCVYKSSIIAGNGQNKFRSHLVTFVASNSYGETRLTKFIIFVDKPTFLKRPEEFNCTQRCGNTVAHKFYCTIDKSEYPVTEFEISYTWYLNSVDITTPSISDIYTYINYVEVNEDEVTINPIISQDTKRDDQFRESLKFGTLHCRIRISLLQNKKVLVYDSNTASENKTLTAYIHMRELSQINSAKAVPSWSIAFIVSFLLIVIVALVAYVYWRNRGETYNVDKKERSQGRDPEKELKEEMFQPYERDGEAGANGTLMSGRNLSFGENDSIGVNSDDGELDQYEVDPGKFDEEGSFIGQYASDPRKNSHTPNGSTPVNNVSKTTTLELNPTQKNVKV